MTSTCTAVLYPVLAAVFYYLGSWAVLTRPLWSRYPPRLGHFMACAACAGTWYAAGVAALGGYWQHWPFFGLPGASPLTVVLAALWGTYTVPLLARLHVASLEWFGSLAATTPEPPPAPPPEPPPRVRRGWPILVATLALGGLGWVLLRHRTKDLDDGL